MARNVKLDFAVGLERLAVVGFDDDFGVGCDVGQKQLALFQINGGRVAGRVQLAVEQNQMPTVHGQTRGGRGTFAANVTHRKRRLTVPTFVFALLLQQHARAVLSAQRDPLENRRSRVPNARNHAVIEAINGNIAVIADDRGPLHQQTATALTIARTQRDVADLRGRWRR